ncbi:DUF6215 domain-containing protein [Streptomyces sp. NPDC001857]|uniref:DUF6215 domain-containing protein n=1 Tax=unclassified Streptomyces TaxID=2593676 RepID=UPI0033207030
MADVSGRPEGSGGPSNAWGQVIAAFVVVGALGGGLWVMQQSSSESSASTLTCSTSTPSALATASAPAAGRKKADPLTGDQLCRVLNRPDLPALLGTPGEKPTSLGSADDGISLGDGPSPEAKVGLSTYTVQLSASYDDYPVSGMAGLLGGGAREQTVLGRPAILYSNRTMAFRIRGDKSESAPSRVARCLVVARDPKDGGGSYEVAIWREDSGTPDDAALLRVAQTVLPTIPGWQPAL